MITRKYVIRMLLSTLVGVITFSTPKIFAEGNVVLYTTNTQISVPPGESVNYTIEVINKSDEIKDVKILVSGVPKSWDYILKSGSYNIQQIAVLPGETKNLSLKIDVPLKVNKGSYPIKVKAGNSVLPIVITVSKQGSYNSEFTTAQANMQGHSKSNFTFRTKLTNRTADKQLYALKSNSPLGWTVTFKPNGQQATSVEIEPNNSKDITVDVKPPQSVKAGTYKIPVSATTNLTSADLELEVVISGNYEMELTTPTGLVSTKITAGDEKRVELIVNNAGSARLTNVKLSASNPSGWEVTFDPPEITMIDAGSYAKAIAVVKADKKAIAGDYIANFTAKTPEVESRIAFRVSVKTPMILGWIGILIIFIALGGIVYLFRKYGRR